MSNIKRKIRRTEFIATGEAIKNGISYNVTRSIYFYEDERITYSSVKDKFVEKLNDDGFSFKWLWAWSLVD